MSREVFPFVHVEKQATPDEKIHLTDYEMADGFTCGALFQSVINTEFSPIGIQICFDIGKTLNI